MSEVQGHIFLTLHHRGQASVGADRFVLGHSAYHWGVLVTFQSLEGDGTVKAERDEITQIGDLPRRGIFYRPHSNPCSHYRENNVGLLLIGSIPSGMPEFLVRAYLDQVLASSFNSPSDDSSAQWALSSLNGLQKLNFAFDFVSGDFMEYAVGFADKTLKSKMNTFHRRNSSVHIGSPSSTSS